MSRKQGTPLFRFLNPELFLKPRTWVSVIGTATFFIVFGRLLYVEYKLRRTSKIRRLRALRLKKRLKNGNLEKKIEV